jgi:hypothetical protein
MVGTIFDRRDRFLCIERTQAYLSNGCPAYVIEDIKLINERDSPPENYQILTQTVDTLEKGTVKRLICFKLVERLFGLTCIHDILFLYRSKRPPQFYAIIGDINGLQMCVKQGTVPSLQVDTSKFDSDSHYLSAQYDCLSAFGTTSRENSRKSDEKDLVNDIPFEIHPKYRCKSDHSILSNIDNLSTYVIMSAYDIEERFHYDFNLERSCTQL